MGNTSSAPPLPYAVKELAQAAEKGNLSRVRQLVEVDRVDLDVQDEYGWSAVLHAASEGHLNIVQYLASKGANFFQKTSDGSNILHHAITSQNDNLVSFLLKHEVDPNTPNQKGWTSLHLASFMGLPSIVRLLVSAGADTSRRNSDGSSPADLATSPDVIAALRERELDQQEVSGEIHQGPSSTQSQLQQLHNLQKKQRPPPTELKGYSALRDDEDDNSPIEITTVNYSDNTNVSNNNNNRNISLNSTRNNDVNNEQTEVDRVVGAIKILSDLKIDRLNMTQIDELVDFHGQQLERLHKAKSTINTEEKSDLFEN